MIKKIIKWIKFVWYGFIIGMKRTEDETLHQTGLNDGLDSGIHKQVHDNRVSRALLKGEVTQEVEDLRYRTYLISDESKKWEYYSPLLARKNSKYEKCHMKYDNRDGREIIVIQENFPKVTNVLDSIKTMKEIVEFTLEVKRSMTPRYKLEQFVKKIIVKKGDNGDNSAIIELYISKYPDDKKYTSKGFVREVEHVMNEGMRTDIFDFNNMSFITIKAYHFSDNIKFEFNRPKFNGIREYDGNYIITFIGNFKTEGEDLKEKYYSERMAKRYENNEAKNVVVTADIYDPSNIRTYICSECGKKVTYDISKINEGEITIARDIEEEGKNNGEEITEYADMEITQQTLGKCLCKKCLEKQMNDVYNNQIKK